MVRLFGKQVRFALGGPVTTPNLLFITGLVLISTYLLFNPESSNIFLIILFLGFAGMSIIKHPIFDIEQDDIRLTDILVGLISLGTFILASYLVAIFLKGAGAYSAQSVFGNLAATATPVLAGNPVARAVVFTILGPIVETVVLFGIVYTVLGSFFKVDITKFNTGNIILISLVSAFFTLLHFTVRAVIPEHGIFDETAIALTFIFAAVSLVTIVLRAQKTGKRELAPIIWLHIFANAMALGIVNSVAFRQAVLGA